MLVAVVVGFAVTTGTHLQLPVLGSGKYPGRQDTEQAKAVVVIVCIGIVMAGVEMTGASALLAKIEVSG